MPGTEGDTAKWNHVKIRKHVSGGGSGWFQPDVLTIGWEPDDYWRYHVNGLNDNKAFEVWTCPLDPGNPAC